MILKGTVGSNPTFSVLYGLCVSLGEIPKRLKGLPWKGSRSLVAAPGFKSLFLRWFCKIETQKKLLTIAKPYDRMFELNCESKKAKTEP